MAPATLAKGSRAELLTLLTPIKVSVRDDLALFHNQLRSFEAFVRPCGIAEWLVVTPDEVSCCAQSPCETLPMPPHPMRSGTLAAPPQPELGGVGFLGVPLFPQ